MDTLEEVPGDSRIFYSDSEVSELQSAIRSPGVFVKHLFALTDTPRPVLSQEHGTGAYCKRKSCRKLLRPLKALSHSDLADQQKKAGLGDTDGGPAIALFQKMEWTHPSWLRSPLVSSATWSAAGGSLRADIFIPSYWKLGLRRAITLKASKVHKKPAIKQRKQASHASQVQGHASSTAVLASRAVSADDGVEAEMPRRATFVYQPALDGTQSERLFLESHLSREERSPWTLVLREREFQDSASALSEGMINIMDDGPASGQTLQTWSRKTKRNDRRAPALQFSQPFELIESCVKRLTDAELGFCSRLRLDPRVYVNSKETMICTAKTKGLFKKTAAQKMFRMDVNKTGKIYDFIVSKGWMERPR